MKISPRFNLGYVGRAPQSQLIQDKPSLTSKVNSSNRLWASSSLDLRSGKVKVLKSDGQIRQDKVSRWEASEWLPTQVHHHFDQLVKVGVLAHSPPHLLRQKRQKAAQLLAEVVHLGRRRRTTQTAPKRQPPIPRSGSGQPWEFRPGWEALRRETMRGFWREECIALHGMWMNVIFGSTKLIRIANYWKILNALKIWNLLSFLSSFFFFFSFLLIWENFPPFYEYC